MIFKTGGHFTNLTQVSCFIAEQLITQIPSRTHKPNVSLFFVYTGNRRIEKARAEISWVRIFLQILNIGSIFSTT